MHSLRYARRALRGVLLSPSHACGKRACNVARLFMVRARRGLCPSVAGMAGDGKNYANTDNNSIELIWESCATAVSAYLSG